jgi:probable F420-dependent oxidoreductase
MKIGATMAFNHHTSPAFISDAAQAVEAAGFHSVWVPEHVVFFPDYVSRYPYAADGRIPGDPEGVLEPFVALTWIAAATRRIRLGTGICLVPQRQPVYTAKQVADLDYLSGGRVDFGVGIGWLREEFELLEMPFAGRGPRTLTYLEVMQALWAPGVSSYAGGDYELPDCLMNPKPVQQPHPPVYFGGESDAALRRVVSHGQGWYGFNLSPADVTQRLARLAELADAEGRSLADIDVFVGSSGQPVSPDTVAAYAAAGVDQLIVPLMAGNLDRLHHRIGAMVEATGLGA